MRFKNWTISPLMVKPAAGKFKDKRITYM